MELVADLPDPFELTSEHERASIAQKTLEDFQREGPEPVRRSPLRRGHGSAGHRHDDEHLRQDGLLEEAQDPVAPRVGPREARLHRGVSEPALRSPLPVPWPPPPSVSRRLAFAARSSVTLERVEASAVPLESGPRRLEAVGTEARRAIRAFLPWSSRPRLGRRPPAPRTARAIRTPSPACRLRAARASASRTSPTRRTSRSTPTTSRRATRSCTSAAARRSSPSTTYDETHNGKSLGTIYVQDPQLDGRRTRASSLYAPAFNPGDLRVGPGDVLDLQGPYEELTTLGSTVTFAHGLRSSPQFAQAHHDVPFRGRAASRRRS